MKVSLTTPIGANIITHYDTQTVVVDGRSLKRSFIVSADALLEDWRPRTISDLTETDLEKIVAFEPEIALLGTGQSHRFPPSRLLATFLERGVSLEIMTTSAACRTYNLIRAEDRRVVAGILLG